MAETEQVGGAGMQRAGEAGAGVAAGTPLEKAQAMVSGMRELADGDAGGEEDVADCGWSFSGGSVRRDGVVCGASGLAGVVQRA
ncbi:hypothetical protein RBB78_16290 [Tunturiibacter empetritectus]|uniref:hypothetical protein n=1 Tax=Tunturiibacter empetritectus TaxID=3069691 RepID=UPI003D9B42B1